MEKEYFTIHVEHKDSDDLSDNAGLRRVSNSGSSAKKSERMLMRERQTEQSRANREERAQRAAQARAVRDGNTSRKTFTGKKKSNLRKSTWQKPDRRSSVSLTTDERARLAREEHALIQETEARIAKKEKEAEARAAKREKAEQARSIKQERAAEARAAREEKREKSLQSKLTKREKSGISKLSGKNRRMDSLEEKTSRTGRLSEKGTSKEALSREERRTKAILAREKRQAKSALTPEERQAKAEASRAARQEKASKRREKRQRTSAGLAGMFKNINPKIAIITAGAVLAVILLVVGGFAIKNAITKAQEKAKQEKILQEQQQAQAEAEAAAAAAKEAEEAYLRVPDDYVFAPTCTANTEPSKLISSTMLQVDGAEMDPSQYTPDTTFDFKAGTLYTNVEGIITFRGNNFRSDPTYGAANLTNKKFEKLWTVPTGGLDSWTGNGWTGQPLIVKWPDAVKQHSNMYESAKNKAGLVEVIYACMDGNIYFLDLETGEATRDSMYLGYTFKGAGALDPRGYPIMYLGAGINSSQYGTAHAFVINLLDCSVMYEFGCEDEFSLRGALSFFDSSALVCAENDTLIYPGENGILYLIRLNSNYDEAAGTVSINPSKVIKWRYDGYRCSSDTFWWGMEDSAVIYSHYLFVADNAGFFMCLDLNTLQLVWVQDVLDDTNDTPVLEFENGHPYLYISTSFHDGWRAYGTVDIPIWKIDAENGEIVWQTSYECCTIEGVSGGVQSTIALGRNQLKDNIYVTVSMVGSQSDGVCVALNKETGEKVFEHQAAYAWSSPACVYDSDGNGCVLYCASNGKLYLLDGLTGEQYDVLDLGEGTVEASPAVYNDMIVFGNRDCQIFGIKLS